tara:strand:- start:6688 stop:6870 length:183 start_codon:yes stop_codon:yes gene_type:complete
MHSKITHALASRAMYLSERIRLSLCRKVQEKQEAEKSQLLHNGLEKVLTNLVKNLIFNPK